LKKEYRNWLASREYDLFASVTLRQGIQRDHGTWLRITPEDIRKTAWLLRDRYTKALVGKYQKLPFLAFQEGDGRIKRYHLHIMVASTDRMTLRDQSDLFRFTAMKLDWVYNEIKIRSIKNQNTPQVISYSLKEGTGAFIPEASFVPS
jgi:hypothetical protein